MCVWRLLVSGKVEEILDLRRGNIKEKKGIWLENEEEESEVSILNNENGGEWCSDDGGRQFSSDGGGRWFRGGKAVVVLVIFFVGWGFVVHNERTDE